MSHWGAQRTFCCRSPYVMVQTTVLKVFPLFQVFFSSSAQEPAEDVFLTELCAQLQDSIPPRGAFAPRETPQLGLHQPRPCNEHSPHTQDQEPP